MKIKKVALLFLLLTFLSGTFTLNRLNLGVQIEVRYIIFFMFILIYLLNGKKGDLKRGIIKKPLIFFLMTVCFYVFVSAISLFYTVNPVLATGKFMTLLFLVLLLLGTLFMAQSMRPSEFFNFTSIFFIIIGAFYAMPVIASVLSGASRGDVNLSGPNVTTRIFFFATCASFYRYSLNKNNLYLTAVLFFLASIILVGSRGGLVGAVFTITLMLVIKILFARKVKVNNTLTFRKLLLIPLCITVIYFIYEPVKRVFMERFVGVTFDGDKVYTSGRDIIYFDAIEMIKEKPLFGHGIDSFTLSTGHVYPHNLLLEMMVEIGLIGALIFIVFLLYSILFIFKLKKSPLFILSGFPLYMIIVQMFSGEFYDFRYFFLWSIPFLCYGAVDKSELMYLENE